MLNLKSLLIAIATVNLAFSVVAFAGAPTTYQVTGPVLEMNDTMIAVQKGKDRWEVQRDAGTKVTGDLKVGAKVTITYTMTASAVEVKAGKADKAAAKASPAK